MVDQLLECGKGADILTVGLEQQVPLLNLAIGRTFG